MKGRSQILSQFVVGMILYLKDSIRKRSDKHFKNLIQKQYIKVCNLSHMPIKKNLLEKNILFNLAKQNKKH